jgi:hypothetical protein
MNLASTDEKKPLTETEKEALAEQFFKNLQRRYKPDAVWKWSTVHNPRGNGLFGLGFQRQEGGQTQSLGFTLAEDDARRLGDILSDYFRLKDAGDPLIYRPDTAQPDMLSGNDSAAVSTAMSSGETLPQQR